MAQLTPERKWILLCSCTAHTWELMNTTVLYSGTALSKLVSLYSRDPDVCLSFYIAFLKRALMNTLVQLYISQWCSRSWALMSNLVQCCRSQLSANEYLCTLCTYECSCMAQLSTDDNPCTVTELAVMLQWTLLYGRFTRPIMGMWIHTSLNEWWRVEDVNMKGVFDERAVLLFNFLFKVGVSNVVGLTVWIISLARFLSLSRVCIWAATCRGC